MTPWTWVQSGALRLQAGYLRRKGHYGRKLAAAAYAAWRICPSPVTLHAWARLRRDLGHPLTQRIARLLRDALNQLTAQTRGRAIGLLLEHDPAMAAELPEAWQKSCMEQLPALGSILHARHVGQRICQIAKMQAEWRTAFAQAVQAATRGCGVVAVGNSAEMRGSNSGSAIDASSLVLRFNQFACDRASTPHVGKRLDVWVVAPGYKGSVPGHVGWVVVSGPAVEYQMRDWSMLSGLLERGTPVLTVPLEAWRRCVQALHAPPSAGVLALQWLWELNGGSWSGIKAAGIGMGDTPSSEYHLARHAHRRSSRHCWPAEARLVFDWESAGLVRLGPRARLMRLVARGAVARIPTLQALTSDVAGVAAWGRKPSAAMSRRLARKLCLPTVQLEDGFIRSYSAGTDFAPLALVVDDQGIYYDSGHASRLESMLNSPSNFNKLELQPAVGIGPVRPQLAQVALRANGISKYNDAPGIDAGLLRRHRKAGILVVDQTQGDLSVVHGGATGATFWEMLAAARAENPHATLYIKTHPEVSSGRKRGYLTHIQDDATTVVLRDPINPISLIEQMDRVYVVTSTLGFEALIAGKPVTCFGVPWYAGWGVTEDRRMDSPAWSRRTRRRTVDELFCAAYLNYTRYLDPVTYQRGTITDVIGWLVLQKEMADRMHGPRHTGRVIGVGLRRWKSSQLKAPLGLHPERVIFVPDAHALKALGPDESDTVVCWGASLPAVVQECAQRSQARLLHVEDGFIRSVGLGSDLVQPQSLVFDERGIYFDATRASDLEVLLQTRAFSDDDLARARKVRTFIIEHGITKYNMEPRDPPTWAITARTGGRRVVLVPGQVEDDASVRLGCTTIRTNLTLLQAVRAACPRAYIVYKPHPDVASGNRRGRIARQQALQWADHVEIHAGVVACIEASDEVHTMTSLTGFDALLRAKRVVTYGQPFYAGWGLTEDRAERPTAFARRTRKLSLDELVAGALLHYPIYWDWDLKGYTTCEAVLYRIVEERSALEARGALHKLRVGWLRRQWRKLGTLARVWLMSP